MSRHIYVVVAARMLAACDQGAGRMSTEKGRFREDSRPQHAVVAHPEAYANLSPAARAQAEAATIEAIVARVPAKFQAEMRKQLGPQAGRDVSFQSSADPELARLLGELISLRQAGRTRVAPVADEDTTIHVILALVPQVNTPGARVSVIRRPDDGGKPIVLLPETDLSKEDILLGLRAAAASYRRHGIAVSTERKMAVRSKARSARGAAVPVVDRNVMNLKNAARINVPGVGRVRAQEVVTNLAAWR